MTAVQITAADIADAARRIEGKALRTPLIFAERLSERVDAQIWLKPETLQPTGSFKIRGATNAVMRLSPEMRARGVITASSGNHGPALAAAAAKMGVACTVCLSEMVPGNKVENVRRQGGTPHVAGRDYDASAAEAIRLSRETGAVVIPAFDHPDIVAGAGTVGKEIVDDLPDVDLVIAPLSGGGLLAGTALAVKSARPQGRVCGVSMERGASMHASLAAGEPVNVTEETTIADALGGNIGLGNQYTFALVRSFVDRTHLVSEDLIAQGMSHLLFHQGLVAEGAGAVGVAALLDGSFPPVGGKIVVVVSGRNIDPRTLMEVVNTDGL